MENVPSKTLGGSRPCIHERGVLRLPVTWFGPLTSYQLPVYVKRNNQGRQQTSGTLRGKVSLSRKSAAKASVVSPLKKIVGSAVQCLYDVIFLLWQSSGHAAEFGWVVDGERNSGWHLGRTGKRQSWIVIVLLAVNEIFPVEPKINNTDNRTPPTSKSLKILFNFNSHFSKRI